MQSVQLAENTPRRSYRPTEKFCPKCHSVLKRRSIVWRKHLITLDGALYITSWGYGCSNPQCSVHDKVYRSREAEGLHLWKRQFGRDVIVHVGYRRFWYHQTVTEIHDWLVQDRHLTVSPRQVLHLIGDFLALLRAAQPTKIRQVLSQRETLVIGVDGMQPEKGNASLYIVRELLSGLTLLAENLDESSTPTVRQKVFQPLKTLAQELGLEWRGVVSDAQDSIRQAVVLELPGVPHQACQSHCLRKAGELTFAADRSMKKHLKAAFRSRLRRAERRIQSLPENDPYRAVLTDYADALHSTLLEGGVAPFALGGIRVFDDLSALSASLLRCQEKGGMCCSID